MMMVVTFAISVHRKGGKSGGAQSGNNQISAFAKAIKTINQPTNYKEICDTTLSFTADPKELIKVTIKNIGNAI